MIPGRLLWARASANMGVSMWVRGRAIDGLATGTVALGEVAASSHMRNCNFRVANGCYTVDTLLFIVLAKLRRDPLT